jgi:hypothetical protein
MKLKDWADRQGIAYLTAWRWFKAKDPRLSNAYQSESGTIIVPDETNTSEQNMVGPNTSNDVMSLFLKKTVEFSKNNASVEEFAAYVLSNFSLKLNNLSENPKYSRNKPKSEEVQNHFKQFIKPKGEKPKPNMFVAEAEAIDDLMAKADNLTAQELILEIKKAGTEIGDPASVTAAPEVKDLMKDISLALSTDSVSLTNMNLGSEVKTYADITEGVVTRSVELTPQLNYTGSSAPTFSDVSFASNSMSGPSATLSYNAPMASSGIGTFFTASSTLVPGAFHPTQKEVEGASKISNIVEKPKRGRKPSKITGNK